MACRSSLQGFGLAENRIVLDDVSKSFGLSLFILGHFFLLGVGLRLSIKWAEVVKFLGSTIAPQNLLSGSLAEEEDFGVLGPLSWLVKSCPPSVPEPFHLFKARS